MEKQCIQIFDQIHTLETGEILGPDDAAAISHLKERYNETVQNIYQNTSGSLWDIIEVFPEEIWIQIIQHALPSSSYSAALLTLTMVSSTWLQALTSTPLFWSYLEIRGSDEDSLATIKTFIHLSRDASLMVTIYLPPCHAAEMIHSTLSSVGERIHQIALKSDTRAEPPLDPFILPKCHYTGISLLLDTLKYTPNVSMIDLGHSRAIHDANVVKTLTGSLPRLLRLRAIHCFCFCSRRSLEPLLPLTQMQACVGLNSLAPYLGMMPQLQSLTLITRSSSARVTEPYTEGDPVNMAKEFSKLSNLTNLSIRGAFRLSWLDLLTAVAQNLVHIRLNIPFSQFPNIFNILSSCIRLTVLYLTLREWQEIDEGDAVPKSPPGFSIQSIKTLRSLTLRDSLTLMGANAEAKRKVFELLIAAITSITALFREVEEVHLSLHCIENQGDIARILECLAELPNLRRLSLKELQGTFTRDRLQPTVLGKLEILDHPLPIPFSAPRLLYAQWKPGADDIVSMAEYDNVRTLHVDDPDYLPQWIRFPQDSLPHLVNLKLNISEDQHLRLGSFSILTSISVASGSAGATSLCIAILYQPDDCPSLSAIEFFQSAPEWDILFIMLERRNFLINRGVSKIGRVTLPFIPSGLRAPLASLLRGLYTNRPKNEDLSFDGTIDLVFDKQTTGCFTCLRYMLGPCKEPVVDFGGNAGSLEALSLSIYSTVDNPPPLHLEYAVVEWIHRREMYTLIWKSAVEDRGPQCWRKATCPRYSSSRVEITEHDVN